MSWLLITQYKSFHPPSANLRKIQCLAALCHKFGRHLASRKSTISLFKAKFSPGCMERFERIRPAHEVWIGKHTRHETCRRKHPLCMKEVDRLFHLFAHLSRIVLASLLAQFLCSLPDQDILLRKMVLDRAFAAP